MKAYLRHSSEMNCHSAKVQLLAKQGTVRRWTVLVPNYNYWQNKAQFRNALPLCQGTATGKTRQSSEMHCPCANGTANGKTRQSSEMQCPSAKVQLLAKQESQNREEWIPQCADESKVFLFYKIGQTFTAWSSNLSQLGLFLTLKNIPR